MRIMIAPLLLAAAPGFAAPEPSVPLFFIPNSGQVDASIRYMVQTPDLRAGFARDSAIFQIQGIQVRVCFAGASQDAQIEGSNAQSGRANFLIGNNAGEWRTNLPTFRTIFYRDLYPGIDMSYSGVQHHIKSEFTLAPNADPNRIHLEYSNADRVSIGPGGELIVEAGGVELREEAPTAFQRGQSVSSRYRLIDHNTVGFEIGPYDRSQPLVIDPVISYSTYLGGTARSAVTGLAVDSDGNLYITGWTEALDFPIAGAVQAIEKGGVDAFIVKLNPTGNALLYATYIGGKSDDQAAAIAVDSSNHAIIAGSTASLNFPLVTAVRSTMAGGREAFVLKLIPDGSQILYSTFLGGSGFDAATAVALDAGGEAYVAGDTQSPDFPMMNPIQSALGGNTDAFITKLTTGGGILFSTFLGGLNDEHVGGIAVDSIGNAYIAGGTTSQNFPVVNPIQASSGGSQDAFVTKISVSGLQILYSTYLGGNGGEAGMPELAYAIAVDTSGNAYVAGGTDSSNFPITPGAVQSAFGGVQDAFVAKITSNGSFLAYSTFLGGASFDQANAIAVDSGGNAYVAGYTSSATFPSVASVQPAFNGLYDAFVSKLNPSGTGLSFSTLYGGTGLDQASAIALDTNGNMFAGGYTASLDFPLQGPIQQNNLGGNSGWVAKFAGTAQAQGPSIVSLTPPSGSGNAVIFTAVFSHPSGATAITGAGLLVNSSISPDFACYVTFKPGLNQLILADDNASTFGGLNSQCTLNGTASGAVLSGNTLTLTIALIFKDAFAGNKSVYLSASDPNVTTGWVAKGSWNVTIPASQPSADSVFPGIGSGASQLFTFVFSDTQSAVNVTGMAVLINSSVNFANACYIVYDRNAGTIALVSDSGTGSGSRLLGSTTVLKNSQCSIGAASATIAGLSNTLMVSITFAGAFSGPKNVYMFAAEANNVNTGWIQRGTFNVAAGGIPVATSVVPGAGTGPAQRFSFTVSDPGGSAFITGAAMLFAATFNTANACSLVYDRTNNTVSLGFDNPANGATPVTPGTNAIAVNSQCTLHAINTTVVIGISAVVVTLDLSFNAVFSGPKNVYLLGAEPGINSGWVTAGTWNVTGGAPTADSVTPASGSGSSPSFTFTVSDSASPANLTGIGMLLTAGSPTNIVNACNLFYNRTAQTIGLYSDDASSLNVKGLGSSATLENSQCAVGFTVEFVTGNSVSFTINLAFRSPAFSGSKGVYIQAVEPNTSSGWVSRGAWTVP